MYKFFLLFVLSIFCGNISAQIPDGYYNNATGLNGDALKTALHNIIDDHTEINYDNVKIALQVLDEDPVNGNNISLIYKGVSIPKTDFNTGGDGWNREHLWPQSHGDFGTSNGPGTDLYALRPADVSINSSRGNKDFANGGDPHDEATGCYFTSDTWQVRDAVKGDVARAVFYMATRYEGDVGDEPDLIIENNITIVSGPDVGYLGVLDALLEWHEDDPVDDAEEARNNAIYNSYQNNRNPFIDHPEYVDLVWGDMAPEPSNHITDFLTHNITLNWTDAAGTTTPDGYLVRMSSISFESIATPVDGTIVSDNFSNKNIDYGVEKAIFDGLTPNTLYYFRIFGYTGSSTSIDYKTDGDVMQISMEAR